MTTTKEALWTLFDRMIYKCEETENKSESFQLGKRAFEGVMERSGIDSYKETDIRGYIAASQRIAYTTGMIEGIKFLHFILSHDTNQINEEILKMTNDLAKEEKAS